MRHTSGLRAHVWVCIHRMLQVGHQGEHSCSKRLVPESHLGFEKSHDKGYCLCHEMHRSSVSSCALSWMSSGFCWAIGVMDWAALCWLMLCPLFQGASHVVNLGKTLTCCWHLHVHKSASFFITLSLCGSKNILRISQHSWQLHWGCLKIWAKCFI